MWKLKQIDKVHTAAFHKYIINPADNVAAVHQQNFLNILGVYFLNNSLAVAAHIGMTETFCNVKITWQGLQPHHLRAKPFHKLQRSIFANIIHHFFISSSISIKASSLVSICPSLVFLLSPPSPFNTSVGKPLSSSFFFAFTAAPIVCLQPQWQK